MKNIKRITIIFSVCFFILICMFVGFVILLQRMKMNDYIYSINTTAKIHYQNFTTGSIELNNYFDINKYEKVYIFGECHDFLSYTAYAGDVFEKDTLIDGDIREKANGYWAIEIIDGVIVSAWSSNYPLNQEQLICYTKEEQFRQMKIFEGFSQSRVIGYYGNGLS